VPCTVILVVLGEKKLLEKCIQAKACHMLLEMIGCEVFESDLENITWTTKRKLSLNIHKLVTLKLYSGTDNIIILYIFCSYLRSTGIGEVLDFQVPGRQVYLVVKKSLSQRLVGVKID